MCINCLQWLDWRRCVHRLRRLVNWRRSIGWLRVNRLQRLVNRWWLICRLRVNWFQRLVDWRRSGRRCLHKRSAFRTEFCFIIKVYSAIGAKHINYLSFLRYKTVCISSLFPCCNHKVYSHFSPYPQRVVFWVPPETQRPSDWC